MACPTFAAMRAALKLRPVNRFQDVNPNRTVVTELDNAYESPADIDLWIGGLAEADRPGSTIGETFHRILADQFLRLRDGDRFWYEKTLSKEMVRMINAQTLGVIIRRNTGILGTEIPNNAFLAPCTCSGRSCQPPAPTATHGDDQSLKPESLKTKVHAPVAAWTFSLGSRSCSRKGAQVLAPDSWIGEALGRQVIRALLATGNRHELQLLVAANGRIEPLLTSNLQLRQQSRADAFDLQAE